MTDGRTAFMGEGGRTRGEGGEGLQRSSHGK